MAQDEINIQRQQEVKYNPTLASLKNGILVVLTVLVVFFLGYLFKEKFDVNNNNTNEDTNMYDEDNYHPTIATLENIDKLDEYLEKFGPIFEFDKYEELKLQNQNNQYASESQLIEFKNSKIASQYWESLKNTLSYQQKYAPIIKEIQNNQQKLSVCREEATSINQKYEENQNSQEIKDINQKIDELKELQGQKVQELDLKEEEESNLNHAVRQNDVQIKKCEDTINMNEQDLKKIVQENFKKIKEQQVICDKESQSYSNQKRKTQKDINALEQYLMDTNKLQTEQEINNQQTGYENLEVTSDQDLNLKDVADRIKEKLRIQSQLLNEVNHKIDQCASLEDDFLRVEMQEKNFQQDQEQSVVRKQELETENRQKSQEIKQVKEEIQEINKQIKEIKEQVYQLNQKKIQIKPNKIKPKDLQDKIYECQNYIRNINSEHGKAQKYIKQRDYHYESFKKVKSAFESSVLSFFSNQKN